MHTEMLMEGIRTLNQRSLHYEFMCGFLFLLYFLPLFLLWGNGKIEIFFEIIDNIYNRGAGAPCHRTVLGHTMSLQSDQLSPFSWNSPSFSNGGVTVWNPLNPRKTMTVVILPFDLKTSQEWNDFPTVNCTSSLEGPFSFPVEVAILTVQISEDA